MSMPMSVTLLKRSHIQPHKMKVHKAGDAIPPAFALIDNEDDTATISGTDESGDIIDISSVATLSNLTSDTPAVATADTIEGMTFEEHALAKGNANISVTATWNDGSVGPFIYTDALTVSPNPTVTGLVISHGTPVVRVAPAPPAPPAPPAQP